MKEIYHLPRLQWLAHAQQILQRFPKDQVFSGQVSLIEGILDAASDEALVDEKIQMVAELKRLYAIDPHYPRLKRALLWYSKWVAQHVAEYADVPADMIRVILDDMESLYLREGQAMRQVHGVRLDCAVVMGRLDEATACYEQWDAAAESDIDDCAACEADRRIGYLSLADRTDEIFEHVGPIFDMSQGCNNRPAIMSSLIPMILRYGKSEAAHAIHRGTRRAVRMVPKMHWAMGSHLVYHAMTGNIEAGKRLAVTALRKTRALPNEYERFKVLRAAALWSGLAAVIDPDQAARKSFPERVLHSRPADSTTYIDLPEFTHQCLEDAREIASRFDARNGNEHYNERCQNTQDTIRRVIDARDNPSAGRD